MEVPTAALMFAGQRRRDPAADGAGPPRPEGRATSRSGLCGPPGSGRDVPPPRRPPARPASPAATVRACGAAPPLPAHVEQHRDADRDGQRQEQRPPQHPHPGPLTAPFRPPHHPPGGSPAGPSANDGPPVAPVGGRARQPPGATGQLPLHAPNSDRYRPACDGEGTKLPIKDRRRPADTTERENGHSVPAAVED